MRNAKLTLLVPATIMNSSFLQATQVRISFSSSFSHFNDLVSIQESLCRTEIESVLGTAKKAPELLNLIPQMVLLLLTSLDLGTQSKLFN